MGMGKSTDFRKWEICGDEMGEKRMANNMMGAGDNGGVNGGVSGVKGGRNGSGVNGGVGAGVKAGGNGSGVNGGVEGGVNGGVKISSIYKSQWTTDIICRHTQMILVAASQVL